MNKRLWTLPVLAAVMLVAASGVGFAIPSLGGPTGIVSVPNALVAPEKTLETALSYQALKIVQAAGMYAAGGAAGMYAPSEAEHFTVWSLQGLAAVTSQAELWAAYSAVRNHNDSHIWGIGGKVQLTKEPEEAASLAVGASYQKWVDVLRGGERDVRRWPVRWGDRHQGHQGLPGRHQGLHPDEGREMGMGSGRWHSHARHRRPALAARSTRPPLPGRARA